MQEKMAQEGPPKPFVDAFHDYFRNLPEQKKNKRSILSRVDIRDPPTPESVQESVRQIELKHAQKPSIKIMKKVLGPVVTVLKDYYGVIDTLAQADPTPGIIIWGSLKIIIDGLGRFIDLFDKIKSELMSLTAQLQRLSFYDDLYGDSLLMQEHLFASYKNVFRFWSRVDKECDRCSLNLLLRAAASFNTKKLQGIVDDLRKDADQIDKIVPIIEARKARGEREDAEVERLAAGLERLESKQERHEASTWRKLSHGDRIKSWLGGHALSESNITRHQNNIGVCQSADTCDWLLGNPVFEEWVDGSSNQPILWIHAGPGSGKSTLCSRMVQFVGNLSPKPAVAFHFYDFDDSQGSALMTARILGGQLFEQYWLLNPDVPESLYAHTQKSAADLKNVLDFIQLLVHELPKTYIFLDGLDEDCTQARWKEASKIVEYVILLATSYPKSVRLWCGSQDRLYIREKFSTFPTLDIKDQVASAVDDYLSKAIPGLNNVDVDEDTRTWILTELKSRAKGNFLWASRMIKTIETEVVDFDQMEQFIKDGLPKDLDEYYRRIVYRYETSERNLASKIFAFITFARRPLRLKELQAAIGMTTAKNPRVLSKNSIPYRQSVERLFAPLIETQPDPDNPGDCFCRLFHSTVKDFLIRNGQIFLQDQAEVYGGSSQLIAESTIANACLLYLSQDRYSKLLVKDETRWLTSLGEDTADHHLLTYSAKYWDKHLDNVEESEYLFQRVEGYLKSPNFQTTIQVQSLCVENHFEVYQGENENHWYTKRVLPRWFSHHSPVECGRFAGDYRTFVSEWDFFLQCGTSSTEDSVINPLAGEVDRCFWGALGPQNFLASNKDRYRSFMLTSEEGSESERIGPYYESFAADGREVRMLQMLKESTVDESNIRFNYEVWLLPLDESPVLFKTSIISCATGAAKWSIYEKAMKKNERSIRVRPPVGFSTNFHYLRIGSQMLSEDGNGDYVKIDNLDLTNENSLDYFEEITGRGSYLVVATRQKHAPSSEKDNSIDDKAKKSKEGDVGAKTDDVKPMEPIMITSLNGLSEVHQKAANPDVPSGAALAESSDQGESDKSEKYGDSSSEESSVYDSADESWSEGSTEPDLAEEIWDASEDDSSNTDDSEDTKSTGHTESEAAESEKSSDEAALSFGQLQYDSDSDGGGIDFGFDSEDGNYDRRSDDFDSEDEPFFGPSDGSNDDGPTFRGYRASPGHKRPPGTQAQQGSIMVYDTSSGHMVPIFKYTQHLPIMLYESPPAIHPTKPLVVWPLCGGDILFADFEGKTYFIRRTRPSTHQTRHVFVKVHFSACGQFLHIASLEAQKKPNFKSSRLSSAQAPLLLSAFVSTHRLSSRKTARSPPTLIHRVKVSLRETASLSSSRMPLEITWTSTELYLSSSNKDNHLTVSRIGLFKPLKAESPTQNQVFVPREAILLPMSAHKRQVQYFPPQNKSTHSTVLIGSCLVTISTSDPRHSGKTAGPPKAMSAPIGFRICEDIDFGGWGPSNAVAKIRGDTDKGQLKRKIEHFDAEDDCDIEHYFYS